MTRRAPASSNIHFRHLVEAAADGIVTVDGTGRIVMANAQARRMFGYAPGELVGRPLEDLLPEQFRERHRVLRAAYQADPKSRPMGRGQEFPARRKDGSQFLAEISLSPLETAANGTVVAIVRDITARKEAEARRQEAEVKYQALVEQLPLVVYRDAADEVCTPLFVSPQTTDMLGRTPEEWLSGRDDWLSFIHPDDRERIRIATEQSVGQEHWDQEYRYVRADGRVVWVHDEAKLLRDENGQPLYWQGTLRDITAQKEAVAALERSEEQFRLLFAANPHSMWVYDQETLAFLEVNAAAVDLYGYDREEFLAMRITDIRPHDEVPRLLEQISRERPVLVHSDGWRHQLKDGRIIDVEITSHLLEFAGRPAALVVAQDVTARLQAEEARRAAEARYRALVEYAADLISILTPDGTVRYMSPSIRRLLGYESEHVMGTSTFDRLHPDDAGELRRLLRELTERPDHPATAELRYRHVDGAYHYIEVVGTNRLSDPAVGGLVLNARDITDHKRLEAQLVHQALHDPLTGLPNRTLFGDRLEHALARSAERPGTVAVLFLDLDDFKVVNDGLGHGAGDELLGTVAQCLAAQLRPGDTLARFGGDEFVVLLEDLTTPAEAEAVAARLMESLRTPIIVQGHEVMASPSVGIAYADGEVTRADEVLRRADLAMYAAKRAGKDRAVCYAPELDRAAAVRLAAEGELRRALSGNELRVVYQPVVELATGRIAAIEALIRWEHPTRGLLPPGEFISLAEQSGLIVPIGEWVLNEACRQVRIWHRDFPSDPPLQVAVNLSPRQVRHPTLVADVARALSVNGFPASCLELEITEMSALEDNALTNDTLRALKDLGVRLAIDDFGAGYAGLSYLRRCPIDVLKIDRSYVAGLERDPRDAALVHAVRAFTAPLGIELTAEGVETAAQLAALREIGCDRIQGYHLSPPLPVDELAMLLATSPWTAPIVSLAPPDWALDAS